MRRGSEKRKGKKKRKEKTGLDRPTREGSDITALRSEDVNQRGSGVYRQWIWEYSESESPEMQSGNFCCLRAALTLGSACGFDVCLCLAVSTEGAKAAERWVTHHVEGRNSTK